MIDKQRGRELDLAGRTRTGRREKLMRDLFDDESPDQKTAINTRPIFQLRDIWPEVLERLQKLLIQDGEGDLVRNPVQGERDSGMMPNSISGDSEHDSGVKANRIPVRSRTVFRRIPERCSASPE
jgi:hypothetical protein